MYQKNINNWLSSVAKIARSHFKKTKIVTQKSDDNNQVLTETDIAIGKYLIKQIKQQYPFHNIIDEEAGVINNQSDYTWVIDPIDGTSNFSQGVPTYGIIIGLLKDNHPLAGGISLPEFNKVYIAEKNMGTFCNGQKVSVTSEDKLSNILLGLSIDGHQEDPEITRSETKILAELILGIRNLRSSGSVFDLGMVAEGKYGGTICKTSKVWDNVGQDIIITESGGKYTDYFGQQIVYTDCLLNPNKNFTYCAASQKIHIQLQKLIRSNL